MVMSAQIHHFVEDTPDQDSSSRCSYILLEWILSSICIFVYMSLWRWHKCSPLYTPLLPGLSSCLLEQHFYQTFGEKISKLKLNLTELSLEYLKYTLWCGQYQRSDLKDPDLSLYWWSSYWHSKHSRYPSQERNISCNNIIYLASRRQNKPSCARPLTSHLDNIVTWEN